MFLIYQQQLMAMLNILLQKILPASNPIRIDAQHRTIECLKRINRTEMIPFLQFIQISSVDQSATVFFALRLLISRFSRFNQNASALEIRRQFGYRGEKNPKQFLRNENMKIFLEFFVMSITMNTMTIIFIACYFSHKSCWQVEKKILTSGRVSFAWKHALETYKHYYVSKIPSTIFCYSLNDIQFGERQKE